MTVETWLHSLLVSDTNSLGLIEIFLAVTLPFLLSFPIAWVYQRTQRSNNFSTAFIHSLFLFSSLSSVMTLIIGSNIARAFGLIGALSIIRFRNALKSPIDAVYIFWALAVGMACGTGYFLAAGLIVGMVMIFAYTLHLTKMGVPKHSEAIVRITAKADQDDHCIRDAEAYFRGEGFQYKHINTIFDSNSSTRTFVYMLRSNQNKIPLDIHTRLRSLKGVERVSQNNSVASVFAA